MGTLPNAYTKSLQEPVLELQDVDKLTLQDVVKTMAALEMLPFDPWDVDLAVMGDRPAGHESASTCPAKRV